MNESGFYENINILLQLLDKAEQILGLVNLPDSTIAKYNQLKQLSFEKLNINFRPLEKSSKSISGGGFNTGGRSDKKSDYGNQVQTNDIIQKLKLQNYKKNIIIENTFDMIEKFKLDSNSYMRAHLAENFSFNLTKQIERPINLPEIHSLDDYEFELKLDDIKIKDFIGKAENAYKKLMNNLKESNSSYKAPGSYTSTNKYGNTSGRNFYPSGTNEENLGSNRGGDMEEVIREYEKNIDFLKNEHSREILEFRQKYEEMKQKYKPDLELMFNKKNEELRETYFILEKINELMVPVYDKFYQINSSWFKDIPEFKCKEIEKVNFLIHLVNRFFSDNKYLVEVVSDLKKENESYVEERNLPFVINSIQKNNVLNEIYDDLPSYEKNSENLQKDFDNIMDFINKNFAGMVD